MTPLKTSLTTTFLLALLAIPFVQTARAGTPVGRYVLTEETAYDRQTGLTWQRTTAGVRLSYNQAVEHCSKLTAGGQVGWRLPSIKELQSIYDVRATTGPKILLTAFPDTEAREYWSSTEERPGSTNYHLTLDFDDGRWDSSYIGSSVAVRCVR